MTMSNRGGRWRRLLIIPLLLSLLAAACGSTTDEGSSPAGLTEGPIKVAFVYVGPVGDAGWTRRHDEGRKELEAAMGAKVITTYVENVPEGDEAEEVFERLAAEGNKVIFGTSFGYGDPMLAVAARHPETVFMHATGYQTAENMGTYFGAAEEARYLSGMAAGAMTKSGVIGYVAAFPIPEVLRGIDAFTLGAQRVNPDVTVRVEWTSTWFDPVKEKSVAQDLIDGGADVMAQHQDTPSTGEAAQAAGGYWVGYNDDLSRFAPKAWLTGPVWDWGPFYISTVQQVIDGTWKSEQYYGNMADGLVTLAPVSSSVPVDVQAEIGEVQKQIVDGTFAPFTGPITRQDGTQVLAAGEVADLGQLLSLDYFVQGVEGTIES
ncbi:MAG: BMP family ABC transporter substrate-binding protein [Acidimicrobiales bacterium]